MEKTVDFAAIGRVAKRSELKSLRLIGITGKCNKSVMGTLVPSVDLDCKPGQIDGNTLQVICEYKFSAYSDDVEAVTSTITYLLEYEIGETAESPNASDLAEFARANGALNSWPFVREVLFGLTSRMGFPPYTLPLMHFNPAPKPKESASTPAPVAEVTTQ
jgi:hypothetical protein